MNACRPARVAVQESRMINRGCTSTVAVIILCACAASAFAGDWPNFRGPAYDGVSTEKGIKAAWSGKPAILWERELGDAFSSFAVVGDRVYTCGTKDKMQVLFCLSADKGDVVWETPFEKEYVERQGGDGTRATPTVNDGRVYVLGARGKLLCADSKTGKEIWTKQYSNIPQWGYSSSVLIEGDMAISSGGKSDGALVAYDKATGKEIWKTGEDYTGYATPYPFDFGGTRYICGFMGDTALIVEAKSGRQVWKSEWKTDWGVNAAAPIFHDGYLFLGSGYRTGCALYKLEKDGDKLKSTEVWRSRVMMPKFQSCVLTGGKLYVSDQDALVCADFLTGKEEWRQRRAANGTMVLADGNLILLTEDGQLKIAKADPTGFKATAMAELFEKRCWTVPVLANGRLYLRDMSKVACVDLR